MAKKQQNKNPGKIKEFGGRPTKSQEELTCNVCGYGDDYVNPATSRCGICDLHLFAGMTSEDAGAATRKKRGIS